MIKSVIKELEKMMEFQRTPHFMLKKETLEDVCSKRIDEESVYRPAMIKACVQIAKENNPNLNRRILYFPKIEK